eukprot:GHVU01224891.1.p1 GENE.GHVU01224891.1~~GHVU01224891.1.p1  ORF type:complete len:371 (+),score=60.19 GHVU01224891.1:282-1394(+)
MCVCTRPPLCLCGDSSLLRLVVCLFFSSRMEFVHWPQEFLAQDFPQSRLLAVDYPAPLFRSRPSAARRRVSSVRSLPRVPSLEKLLAAAKREGVVPDHVSVAEVLGITASLLRSHRSRSAASGVGAGGTSNKTTHSERSRDESSSPSGSTPLPAAAASPSGDERGSGEEEEQQTNNNEHMQEEETAAKGPGGTLVPVGAIKDLLGKPRLLQRLFRHKRRRGLTTDASQHGHAESEAERGVHSLPPRADRTRIEDIAFLLAERLEAAVSVRRGPSQPTTHYLASSLSSATPSQPTTHSQAACLSPTSAAPSQPTTHSLASSSLSSANVCRSSLSHYSPIRLPSLAASPRRQRLLLPRQLCAAADLMRPSLH